MKKVTQIQIVIEVMKQNGGYSRLLDLNREILQTRKVNWKTKTPEASIRRIVQDERYFFKIKPGLWALNEFKDLLPMNISNLSQENTVDTHTYHQGLLVDSGNFLGFKTYIPPQDQNRKYINAPLKEKASFINLPSFTYEPILDRVRTIDVMWFDGSSDFLFPKKVFEVENTTDFTKSLNKFNELREFNVEMIVVAPKHRENQFSDVLKWNIYKGLRNNVSFWDYEKLEQSHSQYERKLINQMYF